MALVFLILIISIITIIHDRIYKKYIFENLTYKCYFSTNEAFEGDEIELIEEVSNEKLLPIPWFKSDFTTSKWLEFAQTQSVVTDRSRFVASFFMLKSYHKVTRKWKIKCLKRGVFEIDKVSVVASDLFGNHNYSQAITANICVEVLPNPVELETLDLATKHLMGEVLVTRHLIADPFYINGIREYSERDPMNKINWLATAKEKRLMVFHNEYTIGQSVAVILNTQSQEYERENVFNEQMIENCINVCASCFYQTLYNSIPIRLIANVCLKGSNEPVITKAHFGLNHINDLLHTLAQIPLANNKDFDIFLKTMDEKINNTDIVIVTSFVNEGIIRFAQNRNGVKILCVGYVDMQTVPSGVDIYSLFDMFQS